jgi:hypothetical protein
MGGGMDVEIGVSGADLAMRSSIVTTGGLSGGVVGFLMFAAVNEPANVVVVRGAAE